MIGDGVFSRVNGFVVVYVGRKSKNVPLAVLDQLVHWGFHLWGRLHCGADDPEVLRPGEAVVFQGRTVGDGGGSTVRTWGDCRQFVCSCRVPCSRFMGGAGELSGGDFASAGDSVGCGGLV